MSQYRWNQLSNVENEYIGGNLPKIKIINGGETNWLDIEYQELIKIIKLLKSNNKL